VNGLVKTLIKPDWDDNPKRSEILHAANLLQIGEFQLIQLAYKVWYRKDLPEEKINRIFSEYMVSGIIPIWVTYYARDIIKMEHANVLNSYDEKYHVYDHEFGEYLKNDDKKRRRRGIFYTFIIGIVFIFSHYMAANYSEEPAGFYPPYIEKSVVYPELYKKNDGNVRDEK
tara:strand:+ start:234 stop:746 length:513 start_codon:yes stop_codon:yes gene_type:complete